MTAGRGLFITGTDTTVGKTAVTAALALGLRRRGWNVGVMKPVATGCARRGGRLVSEDAEKLLKASGASDPMELVSPYRFELPLAPAAVFVLRQAQGERKSIHGGKSVRGELVEPRTISLDRIEEAFRSLASKHNVVLVEGIGGIRVPLNSRHTVADLARRLGLPVLIVAQAGLGTLNHTLLTIEAARSEGLEILGIVLNGRAARPSLAERTNPKLLEQRTGVPVLGIVPTLRSSAPARIARYLSLDRIHRFLKEAPARQKNRIQRLGRLDRSRIWHPFTQMQDWEKQEPLIIESADGVWLRDLRGNRYLDAVSSLWVNLHGHRHPALDRALREQIGRIAHSTLLGAANVPSIELAEELIRVAPKGLTRVFYSDNGSTAVEIALKMAFQYGQQNRTPKKRRFVHFANAYHGDTIGSVSVGGIDLFHRVYGPLLFKGFKAPSPSDPGCLEQFEKILRDHHREIAAVIVEPLVQGAAGMILQPPGWLKRIERICRRANVFLIADEVAVGFGRTGRMFACQREGVRPDFLCVAKGLTGGYLPLAATLTTERVYRGFLGSRASTRAFFHGHSYTGNPLACAVALENLRLFRRGKVLQRLQPKIRLFQKELQKLEQLPQVKEVRRVGLMAGVELIGDKQLGIRVCRHLRTREILMRPLGNVLVLLPPLAISAEEIRFLCRRTREAIQKCFPRGVSIVYTGRRRTPNEAV